MLASKIYPLSGICGFISVFQPLKVAAGSLFQDFNTYERSVEISKSLAAGLEIISLTQSSSAAESTTHSGVNYSCLARKHVQITQRRVSRADSTFQRMIATYYYPKRSAKVLSSVKLSDQ
jgi:hypothetical protein